MQRRLNLPVIKILQQNRFDQNKIIQEDDRLAVHLGGYRYILEGFDRNFDRINSQIMSRFMSPDELRECLTFLRQNHFSEEKIQQISDSYHKADLSRQQTKVMFDENGNVMKIEKVIGYGDSAERLVITSIGYTRRIHIEMEKRSLLENVDLLKEHIHLPINVVEDIVREAVETLDETQKNNVTTWFHRVYEEVKRCCEKGLKFHDPNSIKFSTFFK